MISPTTFRFLLVDDDHDLCELIKLWCHSMRNINVIVEICGTGSSAIERLTKRKYDLVILDLELPDLDGKTVYSVLKQTRDNKSTPVLLHSGYLENNPWAKESGEALLPKPATGPDFKAALTRLLSLDLINKDYRPDPVIH